MAWGGGVLSLPPKLTRVMCLCALQERPWAPRWPCRVPSLAGMGQSSSSGRPATSIRTVPRQKTRANCAVSRRGCPLPPQPTPPQGPIPHLPTTRGTQACTTSLTSNATRFLSVATFESYTHRLQKTGPRPMVLKRHIS